MIRKLVEQRWLAAAVSTGLLMTAAFPPWDLGWLGWLAPIPLFAQLLDGRRPVVACLVSAVVFFLGLLSWMRHFAFEGWLGATAISAAYWCFIGIAAGWLLRGRSAWAVTLGLASAWTVTEWLRTLGPFGFAWGSLAGTQHRYLPLLQVLDVGGQYGLTFLMAATAAAAAALLARRPGSLAAGVAVLVAVGLTAARGAWILAGNPVPGPADSRVDTLRVAVIQASTSESSPGSAVFNMADAAAYERLTRAAAAETPRLVLWPETTLPRELVHDAALRGKVCALLPEQGLLVAGAVVRDALTQGSSNSALVLTRSGSVTGQYSKVLLVPYGEYVPMRRLLPWIERYGIPATDMTPGKEWAPLQVGSERLGVSICFESSFPQPSRRFALRGASILGILTSDGWAGRPAAALQHSALAPLRAVENRRSVARAAATGVSQVIDPFGRSLERLPLFESGFLVADLPLRRDLTWYTRLGDWPVWLSFSILCLLTLGRSRRPARANGEGEGTDGRPRLGGEI